MNANQIFTQSLIEKVAEKSGIIPIWGDTSGYEWCECHGEKLIQFTYKLIPATAARVNAIEAAALEVLRDALDNVEVHPCDQNNDDIKAKQLSEPLQKLYRALKDNPK